MTALRPERDSSPYGGEAAYGGADAFEADARRAEARLAEALRAEALLRQAVDGLSDPLTDPLPGRQAPQSQSPGPQGQRFAGHDETMPLRVVETRHTVEARRRAARTGPESMATAPTATMPMVSEALPPPGPASSEGGRAARRKAAKRRGRQGANRDRNGAQEGVQGGGTPDSTSSSAAPLSRVEARRAARARRPSAGTMASRLIGEVFITTGVLMLLFVTYQLWWSNVRAQAQAGKETSSLQEQWASGERAPGAFEPGQGFAILHIPKLDVVVPIAQGIDKSTVLDRGMVGHYDENSIETAMPEDKTGNFGIAGHRNTHGEPFRYINRLQPGDPIVVETQDTYYVYDMASILPVTQPSNIAVLDPIPADSGFTEAGRYITLTTCTPEFTSKYRMIVWGKMVEERPRSEGKPDALVQ
ncbi:class E sortase [Streptomyces ruber]|uniref:Class E sortase n=2 Tax=Streptomyces TaxID=1883 RepID=A0A918BR28_9ACTN|nr:class E sortase [Streptomyces ruber]GGQ84645.1 class E sortase [Streptomyces ruber]